VPFQAFLVRPEFREADEAWSERIFRNIVGDAAVAAICLFNKLAKMGEHVFYPLGGKAQYSEDGNGRVHPFITPECFFYEGLTPAVSRAGARSAEGTYKRSL